MIKIESFDNIKDIQSEKKVNTINNPKRSKKNAHRNLPNRGVKIVKKIPLHLLMFATIVGNILLLALLTL